MYGYIKVTSIGRGRITLSQAWKPVTNLFTQTTALSSGNQVHSQHSSDSIHLPCRLALYRELWLCADIWSWSAGCWSCQNPDDGDSFGKVGFLTHHVPVHSSCIYNLCVHVFFISFSGAASCLTTLHDCNVTPHSMLHTPWTVQNTSSCTPCMPAHLCTNT